MNELTTTLDGSGRRFAIVASRFNDSITRELVRGAEDTFLRHGVVEPDIDLCWVPGAFEIPLVAQALARRGEVSAIVALGVVVRGATPHFELVAGQAAAGILGVSLETHIPVLFGVLTTEDLNQAWERAGTKAGNKGADAALAALEMTQIMELLEK